MKRLTRQQKGEAAATHTATWVALVQALRLFQHIPTPLWALWPAVVSHNKLLLDETFARRKSTERRGCMPSATSRTC